MHASEHAIINDLLAEHALGTAATAEDQLAAAWRREADRLRHETPRTWHSSTRIARSA